MTSEETAVRGSAFDDVLLTTNGRDTVLGGLDRDHLEIRSEQVRAVDAGWGADDVSVRAVIDGATVTGNAGGDEVAVVLGGTVPLSIDMATGTVVQGDRTMTLTGFERWLLEADAPTTVNGTEGARSGDDRAGLGHDVDAGW